ncbi:hypothetical protein LINPERHAP1_LOCUS26889 [Linum perenne]
MSQLPQPHQPPHQGGSIALSGGGNEDAAEQERPLKRTKGCGSEESNRAVGGVALPRINRKRGSILLSIQGLFGDDGGGRGSIDEGIGVSALPQAVLCRVQSWVALRV